MRKTRKGNMKIAVVGTFTGWMGIHMEQMAAALESLGHAVTRIDDAKLRKFFFHQRTFEDFNRRFRAVLKTAAPDLVLVTMSRPYYDFGTLREELPGLTLAVWDFDGPNWTCSPEDLRGIDLLLTVSRVTERAMRAHGVNAHYLPHGADCAYYSPRPPDPRFASPVSYVGRATARRAELCRLLADDGLALYGRRWSGIGNAPELKPCLRGRRDIIGKDMVGIYTSSTCMINLLQEKLVEQHTILSLQVFAIPASGGCLVTEHTVELEESFVPGRELLVWHTPDELVEQVRRCVRDPEFARRIGNAGRERCLREHTQQTRMRQLLKLAEA